MTTPGHTAAGTLPARLTWQGPLLGPSGYATAARALLDGLFGGGMSVRCVPTWDHALEVFPTREEPDLVEVEMDGQPRFLRFTPPIEDPLRLRILGSTTLASGGVHVAFHPPTDAEGRDFWGAFRAAHAAHRAHVGFTMFETDRIPATWVAPMNAMDEIWVPSTFGRDVFAEAGVAADRIRVVPLPVDPRSFHPGVPPLSCGTPAEYTFLSIFEWTHRKGWDLLFRAFLEEFHPDEDVRLLVRTYRGGGVVGARRESIPELFERFLGATGHRNGPRRRIEFLDRMIPAAEMPALYRAADAFVLPSRGEGWGVPYVESLLCGVPVLATRWSAPLDFLDDEVAHLVAVDGLRAVDPEQVEDNPLYAGHRWAEPSFEDLKAQMRRLHSDRADARARATRGRERMLERLTPSVVAARVRERVEALDRPSVFPRSAPSPAPPLRVLFQARGDLFTLPGGDTEVLLSLRRALEARGHTIDFQSWRGDAAGYDLVHVVNLDAGHALNLSLQGRPFLLTPLFEDSTYLEPCHRMARIFERAGGHPAPAELLPVRTRGGTPVAQPDLAVAARLADRLAAVGPSEAARLRTAFGVEAVVVPLAAGLGGADTPSADAFHEAFGVRDYILCVGRLEARKNQLGLIEALANDSRPLVFVNSVTHQPEYEALCRTRRRRGPTLFTGRIPRALLLSAYAGARVHALPSFYEVPGLVTIEAAAHGAAVVAGRDGAISDYLDDGLQLCDPGDPASIRAAVERALAEPPPAGLLARARSWTWEATAERLEGLYRDLLAAWHTPAEEERRVVRNDFARKELERRARLATGYSALGRRDFAGAIAVARELLARSPDDPLVWSFAGETALKGGDPAGALQALRRAHRLNPRLSIPLHLYLALAELKTSGPAAAVAALDAGLEAFPFLDAERRALFQEYRTRWSVAPAA